MKWQSTTPILSLSRSNFTAYKKTFFLYENKILV